MTDGRRYELMAGDCLERMAEIADGSVDAVVTDPPYGLSFMGKRWDYDVPDVAVWSECLRVLKPGGHLLAFAGTRTQHRMACRIEDSGFEIRDMIAWVYAQGFPKGQDVAWEMHKKACVVCGYMVECDHENKDVSGAVQEPEHGLRFVRAAYLQTPVYACAECGQVLQPFVSEQEAQELRRSWSQSETVWPEQPGMEGWCDVETSTRKLQGCSICSMSHGVLADGAEGWVRHGASTCHGSIPWQIANQDGGRPSYRPQSIEQFSFQPDAFRVERTAQKYRGFNVALKPALEPITLARKPLDGTVAANVLAYGCGGLNIDGCRVQTLDSLNGGAHSLAVVEREDGWGMRTGGAGEYVQPLGRFPANLIHDGSDDVIALFPQSKTGKGGGAGMGFCGGDGDADALRGFGDSGSAARFFYCAKASKSDRGDNGHPTVKPTDLMRYLCRLVTPPNGIVLDPFTGSGSTGKACGLERFRFIGIERDAAYFAIAERLEAFWRYDGGNERTATMTDMRLTDWEPTTAEDAGAVPRYRLGDIVLTKGGEVGVIAEACVIYNGASLDEDKRMDEPFLHGYPPQYALTAVSGFRRPPRVAWWNSSEFEAVRRLVGAERA